MIEIRPQPGPQEAFLATQADIAIYGGSAGSGKSHAIILEPLRHCENPDFDAIVFRRTSPQLIGGGSLWEKARAIYPLLGAVPRETPLLRVTFQSGATVQFQHMQHVDDVHSHQGKEYVLICFDELTHFEEYQFWYMVSRMRSMSGIRPYMRCTTNPDPDSFVRKLIDWWIGPDGFPIKERSGVLRWFIRDGDALVWADTRMELIERFGVEREPMSLTFIAASLDDNPALTTADPGYKGRLLALPEVERARLLDGNWDIRPEAGKYIRAAYFAKRWSGKLPPLNIYMASDYAVSEPEDGGKQPDYTEHGVFGVDPEDNLYVLDWWYGQTTSDVWIETLLDKWARWKPIVSFGEAGVIRKAIEPFLMKRIRERRIYCRMEWLPTSTGERGTGTSKQGYRDRSKRAKAIRGRAFQARAAMGKVIFPANAEWADRVISQCVGFPNGLDDAFDVMSHICLAIDQAHPAIVVPPTKAPRREGDYGGNRDDTEGWRVA